MRSSSFLYIFPAPTRWGTRTAAGGFAPDGAAAFSAPAERGHLNRAGGSPYPGGEFFAEPQRGIRRLRTAGASRRPPRGQKGRTTCGFPSSLNSYLSLGKSGADGRYVTAPKRGTAEGFSSAADELPSEFVLLSNLFAGSDTILLHRPVTLRRARHSSAARFFSALL